MARLRSRLDKLEGRRAREPVRVWLSHADEDVVTGPDGQRLTLAEFERRYPDAVRVRLQFDEGGAE